MKAEVKEEETQFYVVLEPETMAEQVALVRLAMNWTTRSTSVETDAYKTGSMIAYVEISKRERSDCAIPKVR